MSRDISPKEKYLVVFKNVPDKNEFAYLAKLVYAEHSNGLYNSYLKATRRPQGSLMLNLAQNRDELLRFRTDIFPSVRVVYAPVGDETVMDELIPPASTENRFAHTAKGHRLEFREEPGTWHCTVGAHCP